MVTDVTANQPNVEDAGRRLVVLWQDPDSREIEPIGILALESAVYSFVYLERVSDIASFQPLFGFPDIRRRYTSANLFSLFAQRALDPQRADFSRHVEQLGLPADTTPWEQIARSGGRREGDTLQFFPMPVRDGEVISCSFLVNGIRHLWAKAVTADGMEFHLTQSEVEAALGRLQPGDPLSLLPEPTNTYHSSASLVVDGSTTPLGYLPHVLCEDIALLGDDAVVAVEVERVNGPDAPWHIRLMARLTINADSDFSFFSGPSWRTAA
ncbi:HIRAN domain-containing protein [Cryobacterium arcticum]|nr:HIRAN domain-containing protein [Cryobacterium arcticum]